MLPSPAMELQNLVKVKVRTLDPEAEPVEVTVASTEDCISASQVFTKACDKLGLKSGSRSCFSLFDKGERPSLRYRDVDTIPVSQADVYLAKWCFVSGEERDIIHVDPVAAHLVFLHCQHEVHSGKFNLSDDERQKLEECLEPGFVAEDQFTLLCQKQQNYNSLCVEHCTLQAPVHTQEATLESGAVVTVNVSKFGAKLVAGEKTVSFTWFEVSHWILNKEESTLTLLWRPEERGQESEVPLCGPRVNLLLAGVLEMITILQRTDKTGASFHTDMITLREDGCTVWENGLYNPEQAKKINYTI